MDTIVLLITFSAGALAIHHKDRLRHLLPRREEDASVLTDRTLGLAGLTLPDGWRQAHDLNETAGIEAMHPALGRHAIVISDAVEDYAPDVTMLDHSSNTLKELTGSIQVIGCSGPVRRQVGGFEAVQFEIEGYYHQTRVKYLHTTIAGKRAFPSGARLVDDLALRPGRVRDAARRLPRAAGARRRGADAGAGRAGPIHVEPLSKYLVH